MQIKIGYKNYEVEYKEKVYSEKPEELYGQINFSEDCIAIANKFSADQQRCTLLHEVIHGVDNDRGLALSEHQIEQLAIGLFQVIRENPQFVREVTQ